MLEGGTIDPADPADPECWPAPILPGTVRVPEIPAHILPEPAASMAANVAASTQTPPAMAVMTALAVIAAAVQRRFEVAPHGTDAYTEPLAFWGLTALPSGSRKTAVQGALQEVLVRWEKLARDRARSEIARTESARDVITKRIEKLKLDAGREEDPKTRELIREEIQRERESMPDQVFSPRLFTGDVTAERLQQLLVEQRERIAVLSDEGGIFQVMAGAYSGGVASLDVFLQGHSGAPMRVDRAGRMAHLDRPALTFGLALQPGILQDTGKARRFRDSGLMARFLYAIPLSNVGTRDVREIVPIEADLRLSWESAIMRLLDGARGPIGAPQVLPFDRQARECWFELAQDIEDEQGDGGRWSHMSDWTSKLPGAAARIAGLMALVERGPEIECIEGRDMERAQALARLLISHAEAAFRLMGAADDEGDGLELLKWIRRHEMLTFARRDAQRALDSRFRKVERLIEAIRQLQQWGLVSREQKVREGERGAPRILYHVNPRIYVSKS